MLTIDQRTLEIAREKIARSRKETRDIMEYGQPHVVADYPTYRQFVGYLSGLAFLEKTITEAREQAEQEAGTRPAGV